MSGVRIGESSVETLVIVTDKARSPLDMKVMTLEDVPPGQVPTKTTPAVRAGSKLKAIASKKASEGMIRYWAQTPTKTSTGRFKTKAKSRRLSVVPIPNIITPNKVLKTGIPPILPTTHLKLSGTVMPRIRNTTAMIPKYLPIR